ncbi:MAG: Asp-tRNA(Asn)/Glu-tRNA(Gln) amidotransferase subunit GatA [Clostridia bacterium]|nr:Asp-tRNA(Asn)/Glu-tRNA(Gln) amidotransferase subunit GatA [Clostridia bacterium]
MIIENMTAVEIGKQIKSRKLSAIEVADMLCRKYMAEDKSLNAYISFDAERIMQAARIAQERIDRNGARSILDGVPIGIKDNICTRGELTTCASKILTGFVPPYDATVIDKIRNAGLIVAGKLNMDEFAMGSTSETSYYGAVKNPWNVENVPGGSSGGAAAAVAAGEALCALGSDTGGSIRQPASYCGVTGFKPSYGFVSRYGLIAYASSLDQIGPIAKDALDCAAIMDVISGKDIMDSTSVDCARESFYESMNGDISGKTIGVPVECFDSGVESDVKQSVEDAIQVFVKLGAKAKSISLPFIKYSVPTYYVIATAEASSNLSRFDGVKYGFRSDLDETLDDLIINSRSEGFGREVRKRILLGTFVLSSGFYDAYYKKALKMKQLVVEGFDRAFQECDVVVCPTSPMTAPKLGRSLSDAMKMYLSDIFTVSVNLAGLPGLSIPCGFDKNGMPIGAQIIGANGNDRSVLNMGVAFQKATDYHLKRPGGSK